VVHTYDADTAGRVIEESELGLAGRLRQYTVSREVARPSLQRNVGWRAAQAPLIAFTDDDCRPEPDWLERLVDVARANPGAIVQGATRPDPREHEFLYRPHVRTLHVDPPGRFTQTCNILYARATLEAIDGFDERAITGEDIDLAIRAQDAGARLVAAADALVYHAVEALTLREKIDANQKWQHLAYVVKKHPRLRDDCDLRIWWKREHLYVAVAMTGATVARRHPLVALASGVPYFMFERNRFGRRPLARLQVLRRLPELAFVEAVEIGTFLRGSVRYRTLLL
jgi:cellulose synthase/poly-beta-1,6-N-acetylglucosamine synthase-like glycosyltransferase